MSLTTYCLFIFFLSISLHACIARHLTSTFDKKLDKEINFSIKSGEKRDFGSSPKQIEVETNVDHDNVEFNHHRLVANRHGKLMKDKTNTTRLQKRAKKVKGIKSSTSGALRSTHEQSLVSVSWRVPHKKRGEKNPGFNLDYAPPKTHPPSHN
ncbi:Transmembrane protein [Quillaja saponaria]|uniref:Transmembrane protein n=1 Tax=Quillaja saponaria TaxID=32244 RepID=A0AAD7L3K0_QUISA|nr:Transmembrane protein [Quillaja saponaria]